MLIYQDKLVVMPNYFHGIVKINNNVKEEIYTNIESDRQTSFNYK